MATAWAIFKEEFRCSKFSFNYHDHRVFYYCQWRVPHVLYVVVRLTLFFYTVFGFVFFFVHHDGSLMKYFTLWSYLMLGSHFGLAAFLALCHFCAKLRPVAPSPTVDIVERIDDNDNRDKSQNQLDSINFTTGTNKSSQPKLLVWSTAAAGSNTKNFTPRSTETQSGIICPTAHNMNESNSNCEIVDEVATSNNGFSTTTTTANANNDPDVINTKTNSSNITAIITNTIKSRRTGNTVETNVDGDVVPNLKFKTSSSQVLRADGTSLHNNQHVHFSSQTKLTQFNAFPSRVLMNPSLLVESGSLVRLQSNCNMNTYTNTIRTPWFLKLSWILANTSNLVAPLVTTVYFTTIYPSSDQHGLIGIQDTNIHILNSVFVFVDQIISARPIQILHFYVCTIYGALYVIFSAVYWSFDNEANVIYDILDWNYPLSALGVSVGLLVFLPILQTFYFGLYLIRLKMVYR